MASNIQKMDLVGIDLNQGTVHRSWYNCAIGMKDNKGDAFGILVYRDKEPVDLTGISVQGYYKNPQGTNIAITTGNTVEGNMAYVVLPQACYDYDGQFTLAIKLIGGGITGTMRIVDGMVNNTNVDGAVAPTGTVPTYQEVLSVFEQMQDALEEYDEKVTEQDGKIDDLKSALGELGITVFSDQYNYVYNGSNTRVAVTQDKTNNFSGIFEDVTATTGTRAVCQRRINKIPAMTVDTYKMTIFVILNSENTRTKFNFRISSDPSWGNVNNHYLAVVDIYNSGIYTVELAKQNIASATYGYWYNIIEDYSTNISALYVFDSNALYEKLFPVNMSKINGENDANPFTPVLFGGNWDGYYNGSNEATWRQNPPQYYKNDRSQYIDAESGTKGIVSGLANPIPVKQSDFAFTLYIQLKSEGTKRVKIKPFLSTNSRWGGDGLNIATGETVSIMKSGFYRINADVTYDVSNPDVYKYFLIDFVDYTDTANLNGIKNIDYVMLFVDCAFNIEPNKLIGKKWVGYGDSITEQGRWEYVVYNAFKLRFTNLGLGGSCVADVPNASVAGFCDANRIALIPADTDYITIMGGTNDFGQTADIGSIEALRTSFDRTTFMGALAYLIKAVQTQAPNARIIIMSNPNTRGATGQTSDNPPVDQYGHSVYDFAKAAHDVANYMSVDFIDVYACGINTLNRTRYVDDTVHPNVAGGKLIGRKVLEFFSSMRVVD